LGNGPCRIFVKAKLAAACSGVDLLDKLGVEPGWFIEQFEWPYPVAQRRPFIIPVKKYEYRCDCRRDTKGTKQDQKNSSARPGLGFLLSR